MATHSLMKGLMKVVSALVLMILMLQCDPWSLVELFFCFTDGSDHEDAIGHCPDPGVQGGSAVQDVGPAVGGSVAGSTGADGGFDMQYGGPAIQSKLAFIYI